jgi:hypothetical protein
MKANLLAAAVLVPAALFASSCADQRVIPSPPSTTQAAGPAPRPAPLPVPSAATSWQDVPATPGDWRWSLEGGQSVARFAAGRLTLRCDPASRTLRLERSETALPSTPVALTIRTQTQSRTFNAASQAGSLQVSLPARDPLLDAMAFTRGRFAVEASAMPTLYVPSWTEVSRVIEDCR